VVRHDPEPNATPAEVTPPDKVETTPGQSDTPGQGGNHPRTRWKPPPDKVETDPTPKSPGNGFTKPFLLCSENPV